MKLKKECFFLIWENKIVFSKFQFHIGTYIQSCYKKTKHCWDNENISIIPHTEIIKRSFLNHTIGYTLPGFQRYN